MPFRSVKQWHYFEAHKPELERQGVDVGEWEKATDYSKLPENSNMANENVNLGKKGSFSVKKGALHSMLGIPQGEKIPESRLTPKPGDSPLLRRRKASAKGFRAMNHGG